MRVSIRVSEYLDATGKTTVFDSSNWWVKNTNRSRNLAGRGTPDIPPQITPLRIGGETIQEKNDGSRGGEVRSFCRYADITFEPEEVPQLIEGLICAGYLSSEMIPALEEARDKIDSVLRALRPENG